MAVAVVVVVVGERPEDIEEEDEAARVTNPDGWGTGTAPPGAADTCVGSAMTGTGPGKAPAGACALRASPWGEV